MSELKSIETVIKLARSKVIQNATAAERKFDMATKIDWQNRRIFLDGLLRDFRKQNMGRVPSKSVFISYSVKSGSLHFGVIRNKLRDLGFEVLTGFQKSPGDKGNVLARILGQLQRSTMYLGLLTKEMRVMAQGGEEWSPSVWTMEEKGMALALGKPFILLVEKGIHTDYWLKTAPDKVHVEFTAESFTQKSEEIVDTILDRYQELVIPYLGTTETLPILTEDLVDREIEA